MFRTIKEFFRKKEKMAEEIEKMTSWRDCPDRGSSKCPHIEIKELLAQWSLPVGYEANIRCYCEGDDMRCPIVSGVKKASNLRRARAD